MFAANKDFLDSNGKKIEPGCRLIYHDRGQSHHGDVVADRVYNGGMRCNGRSIPNILNEADRVEVV